MQMIQITNAINMQMNNKESLLKSILTEFHIVLFYLGFYGSLFVDSFYVRERFLYARFDLEITRKAETTRICVKKRSPTENRTSQLNHGSKLFFWVSL